MAKSVYQESVAICLYISVVQFSVERKVKKYNKDLQRLFILHQNFLFLNMKHSINLMYKGMPYLQTFLSAKATGFLSIACTQTFFSMASAGSSCFVVVCCLVQWMLGCLLVSAMW